MDKNKYTPTPWEQDGLRISSENGSTVDIAGCGGIAVGTNWSGSDYATAGHAEANAAFIVRACNAHEMLIEALKDCARHPRKAQRDNIVAKTLAAIGAD